MRRHSGRQPLTLLTTLAMLTAATTASALTLDDTKCRAAIQKTTTKLGSTALKAIDSCWKAEMKEPAGTACNDLANPVITDGGKVAKARTKLLSMVGGATSKCRLPDHAASLAEFGAICPSPASDASIGGFADVGACEADIAEGMAENVRRYVLNPDAAAIAASSNSNDIQKCANAIAKNSTKLWSAVTKTRGKCQNTEDKAPAPDGDVDACATFDDGKVADAETKLEDAIQKACGDSGLTTDDLFLIHSCASDVPTLKTCVVHAIEKNAGGVNSTSYEFAGVCPTQVRAELNSRSPSNGPTGRQSNTLLDVGWTGYGHGMDLPDGLAARVNLACSDASCASCAVTASCAEGNCRCLNDQSIACDEPFSADTDCGGNTCIVAFGPPLALTAAGTPLCALNYVVSELSGTADVGTGASTTALESRSRMNLGLAQNSPCPKCSGATVGAAGTCSGGPNNGGACVTNAVHPDFGGTSYQCQPSLAANISGAGQRIPMTLTNGHSSLPFGDACEPLAGLMCACGVCSGDVTQPCNGDADCAGLGTCVKGPTALERRPNYCSDLTCEDVGDELGVCSGETISFCDGFKRKDGSGFLPCSTNADCVAVDSECPGNDCGDCMLQQTPRCFLDPVEATGVAGSDGAELVSTFCWTPTNGAGKNGAYGLPGPARMVTDWDFTAYCPDGTTEFELGGSNCP